MASSGSDMNRTLLIFNIIICTLISVSCNMPQSPYRAALPDSATEIKEHRSGVADFTYLLRAKITHDEFMQYVKRLNLQPPIAVQTGQKIKISSQKSRLPDGYPEWWSPIMPVESYKKVEDSDYISAKYENGYLYLSVVHI